MDHAHLEVHAKWSEGSNVEVRCPEDNKWYSGHITKIVDEPCQETWIYVQYNCVHKTRLVFVLHSGDE